MSYFLLKLCTSTSWITVKDFFLMFLNKIHNTLQLRSLEDTLCVDLKLMRVLCIIFSYFWAKFLGLTQCNSFKSVFFRDHQFALPLPILFASLWCLVIIRTTWQQKKMYLQESFNNRGVLKCTSCVLFT